jgi:DNA-binding MarR family transcriptional regulator
MNEPTSSSRFTTPPPPLIGALLRVSWETVRSRMLQRLHEAGFGDLVDAHLTVLQYPGPQGQRPSELAARLRMSKQAVNYLLGELERLGYLARHPDPDDLRSRRIALTERGESMRRVIRRAVREVERDWERQLGRERFDQLRTLLCELNGAGEAQEPPPAVRRR